VAARVWGAATRVGVEKRGEEGGFCSKKNESAVYHSDGRNKQR
jgi:hypothetical protein